MRIAQELLLNGVFRTVILGAFSVHIHALTYEKYRSAKLETWIKIKIVFPQRELTISDYRYRISDSNYVHQFEKRG